MASPERAKLWRQRRLAAGREERTEDGTSHNRNAQPQGSSMYKLYIVTTHERPQLKTMDLSTQYVSAGSCIATDGPSSRWGVYREDPGKESKGVYRDLAYFQQTKPAPKHTIYHF